MPNWDHEDLKSPSNKKMDMVDNVMVLKNLALVLTGDPSIDAMLRDCIETMRTKGEEYTLGSVDRLHNFRTVGTAVGEPMQKVWFTYFYKHYAAVVSYIKNGQVKSNEPIRGRIMDLIVYLLLFTKMVDELENDPRQEDNARP